MAKKSAPKKPTAKKAAKKTLTRAEVNKMIEAKVAELVNANPNFILPEQQAAEPEAATLPKGKKLNFDNADLAMVKFYELESAGEQNIFLVEHLDKPNSYFISNKNETPENCRMLCQVIDGARVGWNEKTNQW